MRPWRSKAGSRRNILTPVFAGEQSAGEREIGQQAYPASDHGRDRILLHGTAKDAVFVLRRDESMQFGAARRLIGFYELRGREIGAADVADLALLDQVVERAQCLFDRRRRIGTMQLIEVDPIGLQPAQA